MESLVIVFVVGVFIFINAPKKKDKPKDPWEEMGKAIGKALGTLCCCKKDDAKKDGGGGKSCDSGDLFWVIAISTFIGIVVLCGS